MGVREGEEGCECRPQWWSNIKSDTADWVPFVIGGFNYERTFYKSTPAFTVLAVVSVPPMGKTQEGHVDYYICGLVGYILAHIPQYIITSSSYN